MLPIWLCSFINVVFPFLSSFFHPFPIDYPESPQQKDVDPTPRRHTENRGLGKPLQFTMMCIFLSKRLHGAARMHNWCALFEIMNIHSRVHPPHLQRRHWYLSNLCNQPIERVDTCIKTYFTKMLKKLRWNYWLGLVFHKLSIWPSFKVGRSIRLRIIFLCRKVGLAFLRDHLRLSRESLWQHCIMTNDFFVQELLEFLFRNVSQQNRKGRMFKLGSSHVRSADALYLEDKMSVQKFASESQ